MPRPITPRQRQVLAFCEEYAERHGELPSPRQVAERFGIGYYTAWQHLDALRSKGALAGQYGRPGFGAVVPVSLDALDLLREAEGLLWELEYLTRDQRARVESLRGRIAVVLRVQQLASAARSA